MKRIIYIISLLAASLFCNQCEDIFSSKQDINAGFFNDDVVSISKFVVDSSNMFSKFQQVLEVANMIDALDSYNPDGNNFTLFLPTDEAFDQFISNNSDYSDFDDLLEDIDFLISLARYHVVMRELQTNDFPFGALPDTTASGDYLTIGFELGYDSTIYKVNNVAPIIEPNIALINGTIHVISKVLEPVVLSSYDWLLKEEGFTIISEALQLTGLSDAMGIYSVTAEGKTIENVYTLLIEHDSIYHKNNIFTIDDLIDAIVTDPVQNEYTDPNNPLYQFAAYHILENRYFLDAIVTSNYNTYANYPVSIVSGIDIMVNKGSKVYDTVIINFDTTLIDYISILYNVSNVLTKNGAIHFVDEMLELFKPRAAQVTFQFVNEEPVLDRIRNEVGEHSFFDDDEFSAIKWEGVDELEYIKSASSSESAYNKDFIRLDGDFTIQYTIPKVMVGNYDVIFRANSQDYQNATVQIFIDGKRIGSSFDLTSGGNPYKNVTAGKVSFLTSRNHTIEIRTLIPGKMEWDFIRFDPF